MPEAVAPLFRPPAEFAGDLGAYQSPLMFDDGRPVRTADDWHERRREILKTWHGVMGPWPPLIEKPKIEFLEEGAAGRLHAAPRPPRGRPRPDDRRRLPARPRRQGAVPRRAGRLLRRRDGHRPGQAPERRDFAYQLAKRGFVALSLGSDPGGIYPAKEKAQLQPLSYHAYVAANCYNALANLPEVDPKRIGIVGHSYGGKWAMFASCLYDKFACGVWSDPGIVFDETRQRQLLGAVVSGLRARRGRASGASPRRRTRAPGRTRRLIEAGHDLHELHALMAPRPFLVSGGSEDPPERWKALNHAVAVNKLLGHENRVAMTNRQGHAPTEESNEQIYLFFEHVLKPERAVQDPKGSQYVRQGRPGGDRTDATAGEGPTQFPSGVSAQRAGEGRTPSTRPPLAPAGPLCKLLVISKMAARLRTGTICVSKAQRLSLSPAIMHVPVPPTPERKAGALLLRRALAIRIIARCAAFRGPHPRTWRPCRDPFGNGSLRVRLVDPCVRLR